MTGFPGGVADGEVLYGTNKYLSMDTTQYYYTCESDGSIRQFDGADVTTATEYTD